jgi:hypothetical protein
MGREVAYLHLVLYSCELYFFFPCRVMNWSRLMGIRALSYILLCIGIGSVYTDGTWFGTSGSYLVYTMDIAFFTHFIRKIWCCIDSYEAY